MSALRMPTMNCRRRLAFIIALLSPGLLFSASQSGAESQAIVEPANSCDATAYINNHDEKGLNLRLGPGKEYGVIAAITEGENGVEVLVTGSTGGWVMIEGAEPVDEREVYKGKGWVYGPKLAVSSRMPARRLAAKQRDVALYAKPDLKSAVVGKVPPEDELIVTGCRGNWLRVRFGNKEGWLDRESYCGNPVTTCV